MELWIDEYTLDEYVEMTKPTNEYAHKGLNAFLREIRQMGYMFRHSHKIILQNDGVVADYDEEYNKYLDKKASNEEMRRWVEIKKSKEVKRNEG
jgi:endo-alpha-1,4-polygalactosaminidase (GH114 family)